MQSRQRSKQISSPLATMEAPVQCHSLTKLCDKCCNRLDCLSGHRTGLFMAFLPSDCRRNIFLQVSFVEDAFLLLNQRFVWIILLAHPPAYC